MAIIYVYYPEESEVKEQAIYSLLRHPTYHGIILISISSIFFRFSIYSIVICVLFILGMSFQIRFIEEKELLERFGKVYMKYMKETPALFFHPKKIKNFFRFLFNKS